MPRRTTSPPSATAKQPSVPQSRIFLSHAAVDKALAQFVRDRITALDPARVIFVASRPGDIRADQEWLPTIQRELNAAQVYLVLLTPNSIGRPWVWFETGAAWMSDRTLIAVRAAGLSADEIPLPISTRQILSLDDPAEAIEVFRVLSLSLDKEREFSRKVRELGHAAVAAGIREAGWKGMEVGGVFYAWEGPLTNLEDFEPEPEPPGLLEELRSQGLTPGWANRDKLGRHALRGRLRIYATDRRKWRREIVYGDTVLVVSGPSESPESRAARFQEQQRFAQEKDQFLRSHASFELAQKKLKLLHATLESRVNGIGERAPDLQPYFRRDQTDCVVRLERYSALLAWDQKYLDCILEAKLILTESNGLQQLSNDSVIGSRKPEILNTISFELAEAASGEWSWKRSAGDPEFFSAATLADFALGLLMERIERPPPPSFPIIQR